jgi:hypothetical protein
VVCCPMSKCRENLSLTVGATTHRSGSMLSKGHIIQGTERPRTNVQGHIGRGHIAMASAYSREDELLKFLMENGWERGFVARDTTNYTAGSRSNVV